MHSFDEIYNTFASQVINKFTNVSMRTVFTGYVKKKIYAVRMRFIISKLS